MPCGVFDKRRGGHRCIACRRAHAKCDGIAGQKTCSYCRARLLNCSYSPRVPAAYQIVRARVPGPPHAIVLDTWKYVTACFGQASGTLAMFESMRGQEMVALSQSNPLLRKTVEIVGEVYMALASGESCFIKQQRKFQKRVLEQRMACSREIRALTANKTWSPAALGSVLMLPIIGILVFGNVDPCHLWGSEVSDFIVQTTQDKANLTPFEADLIRLFQAIDVINSVARNKQPACPDFSSTILADDLGISVEGRLPAPKILRRDTDYIYSAMWHWAGLQKRMFAWLAETMMMAEGGLSAGKRVEGIEIICAASSLQVEMLEHFLTLSDGPGPDHYPLISCSYWILTGITQLLRNEGWKLLDCDIAILAEDHLHQYALSTLESLDTMTSEAGLCAVALLPIVFSMGFEMKTEEERGRVLGLLEGHRARGPDLVDQFRQQLELTWPGIHGPFTPPPEVLLFIYSHGVLLDKGAGAH